MLLPIVAVGPVVALGASLVYCAKGREETKKPNGGLSSWTKKPSRTPKSIKSFVKSNHSSKNGSKGPRSTSRSSKRLSSKPRSTQKKLSKRGSDKKSSKGKKGDKSDKSKSKKDKKEKDPKKEKSEKDKKSEKEAKSEKEKKKDGHNEQKIEAPFKFCDLNEKLSAFASLVAAPQTVEMKMTPSELNWKTSGGLRQVHIVNNSNERRAIKAKCTDNLIYRVHPVHGFIEPGESFKVDVLRNNAAGKSDVLVFLTTKAQDKKDPRECFANKTQPTEMLVMPLLPEKVES